MTANLKGARHIAASYRSDTYFFEDREDTLLVRVVSVLLNGKVTVQHLFLHETMDDPDHREQKKRIGQVRNLKLGFRG